MRLNLKDDFTKAQVTQYFSYLDALRKAAITNMYSAHEYLRKKHPELSPQQAQRVCKAWRDTFDDIPLIIRINEALGEIENRSQE